VDTVPVKPESTVPSSEVKRMVRAAQCTDSYGTTSAHCTTKAVVMMMTAAGACGGTSCVYKAALRTLSRMVDGGLIEGAEGPRELGKQGCSHRRSAEHRGEVVPRLQAQLCDVQGHPATWVDQHHCAACAQNQCVASKE
jgi:hypothetical protein